MPGAGSRRRAPLAARRAATRFAVVDADGESVPLYRFSPATDERAGSVSVTHSARIRDGASGVHTTGEGPWELLLFDGVRLPRSEPVLLEAGSLTEVEVR